MAVQTPNTIDLFSIGIHKRAFRNLSPSALYKLALEAKDDSAISSTGALISFSGAKTGRSPKDKRIVKNPASENDIWWGKVNIPFAAASHKANRDLAVRYLNEAENVYVLDGYAGWDEKYRLKVRVITTRPYHALFMHNMLIRPTDAELASFGEPDYIIYNAGHKPADRTVEGVTSTTSVSLSFEDKDMVILGTEYAGEMKKGVFTIMNYLMPKQGELSMHCSATAEQGGERSAVLFGLSGTGKTTLSADPNRNLIGDDEHYVVQYDYTPLTSNTRASYPIEYISNARIPCKAGQPTDIVFLTCDAFGVLPPVSKLSPAQAMYHFISGYTAKVAGTEVGVTEPEATFSACFGAPFMVWHPAKYAELLAEKMKKHNTNVWLINTGWAGGAYGVGERIKLKYSRAIIDAINSGELAKMPTETDPVFGFDVVTECPNVPSEILKPRNAWADKAAYDAQAKKLAKMFNDNFAQFADGASAEVKAAAPKA